MHTPTQHTQVGVFRLQPDKAEAQRVKDEINSGTFAQCSDVCCISNLIKVWFREMPAQLLTFVDKHVIDDCQSVGVGCMWGYVCAMWVPTGGRVAMSGRIGVVQRNASTATHGCVAPMRSRGGSKGWACVVKGVSGSA